MLSFPLFEAIAKIDPVFSHFIAVAD